MAKFRKVEMDIKLGSGYGQYIITANYKGKEIKVHTTNGTCYDWLNDDSFKTRHQEAKRYAYGRIVEAYERQYSRGYQSPLIIRNIKTITNNLKFINYEYSI